ncbi:MAG: hypothetical protein KBC47_03480 [Candidatus Peribacteraceae bacterium]|nr:hypothetical protein [Candidatus Peribacteraceae bacterium]
MRYHIMIFVAVAPLVFSACGTQETPSLSGTGAFLMVDTQATVIPAELSKAALASASYTIIDPTVRKALTNAGQNFQVYVRGGMYTFPPSVLVEDFRDVTVDIDDIVYGDLTGDGIPDAIVKVTVGKGELSTTELAAFTASGGTAHQFAAFPLGHAEVKSVAITSGKIRVNFEHTVLGDPGSRSTQLMLELPKK